MIPEPLGLRYQAGKGSHFAAWTLYPLKTAASLFSIGDTKT